MYWSTYRLTLDWCIGWHIDRHSTDISANIFHSTYWPIYRPWYRLSVSRHIVRLSAYAAETRPIHWPLTVGGISVHCRLVWLNSVIELSKKFQFDNVRLPNQLIKFQQIGFDWFQFLFCSVLFNWLHCVYRKKPDLKSGG